MKRLIVNADDFGLTRGVNRGITEAHHKGIVTSATLMANVPAFADALICKTTMPRLGTGCHVVLLDGEPVSTPASIPSLTRGSSRLQHSLNSLGVQALLKLVDEGDIEREALRQFEKIVASGIALSHFDCHKHAHVFPHLLAPLLACANTMGIRAVRNPFEPAWATSISLQMRPASAGLRYLQVSGIRSFEPRFRQLVRKMGLRTTDGCLGVVVTGLLDEEILAALLRSVPQGTWELVCHPGYFDSDLKNTGGALMGSREVELRALTSPQIRAQIEDANIELISYDQL